MSDHEPVVVIDRLTKKYGEFTAVDDVSLTLDRGRILGFIGPNGAGKSTLARLVLGLVTPDRGTVVRRRGLRRTRHGRAATALGIYFRGAHFRHRRRDHRTRAQHDGPDCRPDGSGLRRRVVDRLVHGDRAVRVFRSASGEDTLGHFDHLERGRSFGTRGRRNILQLFGEHDNYS